MMHIATTVAKSHRYTFDSRFSQRGLVLFVALIVLVVMSLAGIGLMRSLGTTTGIAGNLAFRESAITSADAAIELGIAFIEANRNSAVLNNDVAGEGYYAAADLTISGSSSAISDWSRYNWAGRSKTIPGADASGNAIQYVIERLCSASGTFGPTNACASKEVAATDANNSKAAGGELPFTTSYLSYRVTTRITDPKGSTNYVQVMAY